MTEAFATQPLTGVVTGAGAAIDERMRFVNYNVDDEVAKSYQILTTIDAKWKHSNKLFFRNYTYFLNADREWRNSENYTFNSGTSLVDRDTFFEDTLKVTEKLRLVVGMRQDHIELFRLNFNDPTPGTSFERTYNPFSWRVGAVYEIAPSWNVYAQMSSGTDPLGSDVFLVNSNQNFDLSTSQQWEAGLKSKFLNGKAEMTLAVYHIERQNILIQDSNDSVLGGDGGQRSTGFELEGSVLVTPKWRVGANTAYTDAEFGVFENVSGNTPSNVPEWVANIWTNYRGVAGLPIDVGGSFRYVDDRFNTRFNTVKMLGYETVDLHATYRKGNGRYTARLTNLFDKAYALWGDEFYSNQLILGSPRAFEISAQFDF